MTTVEKHSFKIQIGTAVGIIITVILAAFSFSATAAKVTTQQDYISERSKENRKDIDILELRTQKNELLNVEISTRLTGIDTRLMEIQAKIN